MPTPYVIRLLATLLVCLTLTGCDIVDLGAGVPPGGRRLVVTVENQSFRPARLVVAVDLGAMGEVVWTASPSVVPPGATVDVTFGVPQGGAWAIFVNPGPRNGALVGAADVPREATGKVPFKIFVNADGSSGAELPGEPPGWFGN